MNAAAATSPLDRKQNALWALSVVRIKLFLREPGSLFWVFVFPLLITVALGVAFRTQGPPRTAVAVEAGPAAAATAAALADKPGVTVEVLADAEAERRLRTGEVALIVDAPATPGGPVTFRYDPSRPEAPGVRRLVDDMLQERAGRRDPVATRDETAVVRGARYVDWMIPGLLGMQLLNGAMWGAAFNIVNARQRKLLKRLAATPMRRGYYLLSYRVSGLLFVPLQLFVLFGFARLAFGVVIQGSVLATLVLALLGSWSFAGIGLLCAARAENSETANGLINLVTLPMLVLSGVFFSASKFPHAIQPVIRLLPLTAFNDALRHVVNDGASIFAQGFPLAVLVGWGVVTTALALRWFRWT
jgi:ABC-type multidrug transport system permease subunit